MKCLQKVFVKIVGLCRYAEILVNEEEICAGSETPTPKCSCSIRLNYDNISYVG